VSAQYLETEFFYLRLVTYYVVSRASERLMLREALCKWTNTIQPMNLCGASQSVHQSEALPVWKTCIKDVYYFFYFAFDIVVQGILWLPLVTRPSQWTAYFFRTWKGFSRPVTGRIISIFKLP